MECQESGCKQASLEKHVHLASAATVAVNALCSELLLPGAPAHPVLLSLLTQQGRLQQLLQVLLHFCTTEQHQQQKEQYAGVQLFYLLWEVEEVAAQPQIAAALQQLVAAALRQGDAATYTLEVVLAGVAEAPAARQQLLQHAATALAAVRPGAPTTAAAAGAAWRLLSSMCNCSYSSDFVEAILQQDWSFLLQVMLGEQCAPGSSALLTAATSAGAPAAPTHAAVVAAAAATAASAAPVEQGLGGDASTEQPEAYAACSAARVVSALARHEAGRQQLATGPNIRALLLAALPPHLRPMTMGGSSSGGSSRGSGTGGGASGVVSGSCSAALAGSTSDGDTAVAVQGSMSPVAPECEQCVGPDNGGAWCEGVASLSLRVVESIMQDASLSEPCEPGPAAVFEHISLLLAVMRIRSASLAVCAACDLLINAWIKAPEQVLEQACCNRQVIEELLSLLEWAACRTNDWYFVRPAYHLDCD